MTTILTYRVPRGGVISKSKIQGNINGYKTIEVCAYKKRETAKARIYI